MGCVTSSVQPASGLNRAPTVGAALDPVHGLTNQPSMAKLSHQLNVPRPPNILIPGIGGGGGGGGVVDSRSRSDDKEAHLLPAEGVLPFKKKDKVLQASNRLLEAASHHSSAASSARAAPTATSASPPPPAVASTAAVAGGSSSASSEQFSSGLCFTEVNANLPSATAVFHLIKRGEVEELKGLVASSFNNDLLLLHQLHGLWGSTPLLVAIQYHRLEVLNYLFSVTPSRDVINHRNERGAGALLLAIVEGLREVVLRLIALGADLQPPATSEAIYTLRYDQSFICTPFTMAIIQEEAEVVALLVEEGGCSVNAAFPFPAAKSRGGGRKGLLGLTPVLLAASFGHGDLVVDLVRRGADLSVRDEEGSNVLHHLAHAAGHAKPLTTTSLPATTPTAVSPSGNDATNGGGGGNRLDGILRALDFLLLHHHPQCLSLFNDCDCKGDPPLLVACESKVLPFVQRLLEGGSPSSSINPRTGWSPLHLAVKRKQIDLIKLLLEHGADPLAKLSPEAEAGEERGGGISVVGGGGGEGNRKKAPLDQSPRDLCLKLFGSSSEVYQLLAGASSPKAATISSSSSAATSTAPAPATLTTTSTAPPATTTSGGNGGVDVAPVQPFNDSVLLLSPPPSTSRENGIETFLSQKVDTRLAAGEEEEEQLQEEEEARRGLEVMDCLDEVAVGKAVQRLTFEVQREKEQEEEEGMRLVDGREEAAVASLLHREVEQQQEEEQREGMRLVDGREEAAVASLLHREVEQQQEEEQREGMRLVDGRDEAAVASLLHREVEQQQEEEQREGMRLVDGREEAAVASLLHREVEQQQEEEQREGMRLVDGRDEAAVASLLHREVEQQQEEEQREGMRLVDGREEAAVASLLHREVEQQQEEEQREGMRLVDGRDEAAVASLLHREVEQQEEEEQREGMRLVDGRDEAATANVLREIRQALSFPMHSRSVSPTDTSFTSHGPDEGVAGGGEQEEEGRVVDALHFLEERAAATFLHEALSREEQESATRRKMERAMKRVEEAEEEEEQEEEERGRGSTLRRSLTAGSRGGGIGGSGSGGGSRGSEGRGSTVREIFEAVDRMEEARIQGLLATLNTSSGGESGEQEQQEEESVSSALAPKRPENGQGKAFRRSHYRTPPSSSSCSDSKMLEGVHSEGSLGGGSEEGSSHSQSKEQEQEEEGIRLGESVNQQSKKPVAPPIRPVINSRSRPNRVTIVQGRRGGGGGGGRGVYAMRPMPTSTNTNSSQVDIKDSEKTVRIKKQGVIAIIPE